MTTKTKILLSVLAAVLPVNVVLADSNSMSASTTEQAYWDETDFEDNWEDSSSSSQEMGQQGMPSDQGSFNDFPEWSMDMEIDPAATQATMPKQPSMPATMATPAAPQAQPTSSPSNMTMTDDPFSAFPAFRDDMSEPKPSKPTMAKAKPKPAPQSPAPQSPAPKGLEAFVEEFIPSETDWEAGFDEKSPMGGVVMNSDGTDTLSIDFAEEEIRIIIRAVADVYKLNVVIPDTLVGIISVKLHSVSWQQVFDAVLEPVGFAYIQENGIIKIKSLERLQTEPVENRIFALRFASAQGIIGTIQGLVDPEIGGTVVSDARTNVLIVNERPSRLQDIETVIKRLDAEEAQIMIETKIVEHSQLDTHSLGVNWSSLSGYGLTGLAGTVTDNDNVGGRISLAGTDAGLTHTNTRSYTAVLSADNFRTILNALNQDQKNKLVASPNIVTMNNTPATISIQKRSPVPNYEFNEQTGKLTISGFEYIDVGIKVEVTPQAKEDLITLDIKPNISTTDSEIEISGGDTTLKATVPVVSARETQSIVTIKSGYTVALGGLMKESPKTSVNRVPGLGHIPLLGRLFTSESNGVDNQNLILFVTATQIGFDGDIKNKNPGIGALNANPRWMNELGITDKDVPMLGEVISPEEQRLLDELAQLRKEIHMKQTKDKLEDSLAEALDERAKADRELKKNKNKKSRRA